MADGNSTLSGEPGLGPWGALAGGIAGAGLGWLTGNQAVEAKRKAALEQARRLSLGTMQAQGQGEAAASASGVEGNSASMQKYLADMAAEYRRQNEWAVSQANNAADIGQTTNTLQGITGLGTSLFNFARNNNFWQTPPAGTGSIK